MGDAHGLVVHVQCGAPIEGAAGIPLVYVARELDIARDEYLPRAQHTEVDLHRAFHPGGAVGYGEACAVLRLYQSSGGAGQVLAV